MLDLLINFVIPFVIFLSVLVLIHEFGHYITAKKFGIKVEEFGFGFPPRLFGKKVGETLYSINALPIGGFVKLYGEDAAGGGSVKGSAPHVSDVKRAFFARPAWQRALIVLAGVIMNFLLAVVIISYLFTVPGVPLPKGYPEVVATLPNTPAAEIQLQKGDHIISFDGQNVKATSELRKILAKNGDKKGTLVVDRSGEKLSYEIVPQKITEGDTTFYAVGIESTDIIIQKYPWYQAPFFGTIEALKFSWMILASLGQLVSDLAIKQQATGVGGPVAVAQLTGDAVKSGLNPALWVMALLSLNLAVVNVLPIPALDGGRLFFILFELITRRKVPQKYETMSHAIGLAVLLSLILIITFFDIARLLSGQSLLPKM